MSLSFAGYKGGVYNASITLERQAVVMLLGSAELWLEALQRLPGIFFPQKIEHWIVSSLCFALIFLFLLSLLISFLAIVQVVTGFWFINGRVSWTFWKLQRDWGKWGLGLKKLARHSTLLQGALESPLSCLSLVHATWLWGKRPVLWVCRPGPGGQLAAGADPLSLLSPLLP